jgi:hypothetical protein
MDKVAKERQRDGGKKKILRLLELMAEVLVQTENVGINLSDTERVFEPWVDLWERAAVELAETKDWTSRVESDVARLRTSMAKRNAKVEEVQ